MQHEDRFAAERGRQLLIAVLFVSCAVTAVLGLSQILAGSKPPLVPIGPFVVALIVAYFVFKGSMVARVIFALYSGARAAGWLGVAASIGFAQGDINTGAKLLLIACINAFAAWATFGVPQIQAYWATARAERDGST